MRYQYILLEWPNSKALTMEVSGKNAEQQELPFMAGGEAKWYRYFERKYLMVSAKLNMLLPYDQAITLLGLPY